MHAAPACPPVDGFVVYAGVDHVGDDITRIGTGTVSMTDLAEYCR